MQSAAIRNIGDVKERRKTRKGDHITIGGFLDGQGLSEINIKIGPFGIEFKGKNKDEQSR